MAIVPCDACFRRSLVIYPHQRLQTAVGQDSEARIGNQWGIHPH
ncbi:MAG TPA: hypothetical protein V6D12_02585 [Candidatus Obscuribacterales bacterium]